MGLGPGGSSLYRLGNGETYYDIWDILNDVEQHDARLQIQASAFTTRGVGSLTKAESASLAAEYICAAKMNADHEHFMHPAFYSHRLESVVHRSQ